MSPRECLLGGASVKRKHKLCYLSVLESKNIQSIQGRNTEADFVVCDGNKTLGGRIYHSSGSCLGMVNQFLKR